MPTGRTRWLQTVKRPTFDDQGRVQMVLGAATDITERKRMEEILVQRERDLSAALQERERISQDLHDGILQSLYAVGLGLEVCKLTDQGTAGTGGCKVHDDTGSGDWPAQPNHDGGPEFHCRTGIPSDAGWRLLDRPADHGRSDVRLLFRQMSGKNRRRRPRVGYPPNRRSISSTSYGKG